MLTMISCWFEPVRVSRDYSRADMAMLGLLLAIGTWLRFWALGEASLHGDEDIMALAARGVLEQGMPVMPSSMVYVRAPLQVYLIAGSMQAFGDNEWAIRFPSAVVGSLCGLLAFFFGKRFLGPRPNLAFVALISFLPIMIEISKTGRMYVFLVAGLLLFGTMIFRWERTGRWPWLGVALAVWLMTFQFHALAMFALPILLFPGLANGSLKQFVSGAFAIVLAVPGYHAYKQLQGEFYPGPADRLPKPPSDWLPPFDLMLRDHGMVLFGAVVVAVALGVMLAFTAARRTAMEGRLSVFALTIGVLACAVLHYHVGAISLLAGSVLWIRSGHRPATLAVVAGVIGVIAVAQALVLQATGAYPGVKIIRAMLGMPSVVPMIRLSELAVVGVIVYLVALSFALTAIARGRKVPAHFLFFMMAVWLPLFAIGTFRWDFPGRYLVGIVPFLLVCVVAGLQYIKQSFSAYQHWRLPPAAAGTLGLAILTAMINPVAAYETARNDHSMYPDHRGAADFVRSASTDGNAILIAEDSIVQTYYLGRVDYRLLSADVARTHSILSDGRLKGQYTGTTILGSGKELAAILDNAAPRPVFIIGSGNYDGAGGVRARANGIREVLSSDRLELVYVGRDDGRTQVWRLKR